ncbi:MAG TPA: nickel pincer cofactor biosynthesis protein LarC, partial [Actinobacteria bacterium]|nr:nickel pincer cofactor biosynthesis protein LarC [Actinomycetota bacterium]
EKLPLQNYEIRVKKVDKLGIGATKVSVQAEERGIVRTWTNIKNLIDESAIAPPVKERSKEIFLKLAQAEAKIHQKSLDQIHFHEIGATDSIVDIVGAAIGLHRLGIEEVYSSPLATGMGLARTEHGAIPIPSPATLEILRETPIYSRGITAELTTPTGAAIIKTYAKSFGDMPPMRMSSIGYGAGTRDLEIPNVLRLILGKTEEFESAEMDEVLVIETNIDDLSPEFYGYITEKLFEAGAFDVWASPIYMKKNRPGLALSVLAKAGEEGEILDILFRETTTFGVRLSRETRRKIGRETIEVKTEFGRARVKVGRFKGKVVSLSPEYEDCARLAREAKVPLRVVYAVVEREAEKRLKPEGPARA